MTVHDSIARRVAEAPTTVDLTLPDQDRWIRGVADELLAESPSLDELRGMEEHARHEPVSIRLAIKLARSKLLASHLPAGAKLSVVFAVYKEHNRLVTRAAHPHGENLLVRKTEQIEWLLDRRPAIPWELIVVDDGCPEGSGEIAERIVEAEGLGDRVSVLYLRHAIERGDPIARGLRSTDDSQKGGSIQYGMSTAAESANPKHVVVFTDADLSTHLGQLGALVDPVLVGGYDAAIGSRREPLSVVIKGGARNVRGKLFIYLWKRLIPVLSPIVDTQCGFKAFRADIIPRIVANSIEKKFAFDIELLVRTELASQGSIARVPVAWIDSEAASTTKDLQPYLPMLRSLVKIADRYLPPSPSSSAFAELVSALDERSWSHLCDHVPPEIATREPSEFDRFDAVSAEDLARAAHSAA